MDFKDKHFCSLVFNYIQRHKLLPPTSAALGLRVEEKQALQTERSRVLLAVSGGLDSMVLLHFFQRFASPRYKLEFVVAHLDHGLRDDSLETAAWLAEYCTAHKLTYVQQRLDVFANLQASPQSSLEAVARETRYTWLEQQALQHHCSQVLTAHSASDQLETVLMRLVRGGIAGLGGMAPSRSLGSVHLIRPLLAVDRPALEAYAAHHKLKWCEDPSNQYPEFFRNRVRAELVPWLLKENPDLARAINDQTEIWRDEQTWLSHEAQQLYHQLVSQTDSGPTLSAQSLLKLPPALQRRLVRELLTQHLGHWKLYTSRHIEAVLSLAAGPNSKQIELPGNLNVSKISHNLIFRSIKN